MKAGWHTGTLVSVSTEFTDGDWIESKDQSETGIRLVQTGNVGIGEFKDRKDKARFIDEDTFERLKCFEVLPNDCLISRLPDPVGRGCLIPETSDKMITAVDCSVVRIDKTQMLPAFFLYYLQSNAYFALIEADCSGTTRKRISRKKLEAIPIPIPTLEEQKRIVAVLDAAFEGLTRAEENAKANLQNARELFEALLEEFFLKNDAKWLSATLQDTVTTECSLSYGIVQPGDDVEGGIPVVRPTDLGLPLISRNGLKTIAPEKAEGYKRTRLVGDEILLCVRGTTGVVAKALPELEGGNVTRGIVPIRFDNQKMLQDFGYYQFLSRHIQNQIDSQTYGAALRQINIRDLRKLSFSFPDISEQKILVPMLQDAQKNCERLVGLNQTKLTDIADLRQSLLQKAFAGELT